jgi:serine/threonine-protein kinase
MHLSDCDIGEIFLVEHALLGTRHAAKVLRAEYASDHRLADRVRLESQALARLEHPHIIAATDFGRTVDGRPYFVMEHLEGCTLEELVAARGPLPLIEAVAHCGNILSALTEAHHIGLVHRNLTPANVFIAGGPEEPPVAKVTNFGLARVLPQASSRAPRAVEIPTEDNVVLGAPRFVSPEGALGDKVDERADLYAVGLLLYVMLAGRGPFDHLSRDSAVLEAHVFDEPPPLGEVARRKIPPALIRIVERALSKSLDGRYATAMDFHRDLSAVWIELNCPSQLRDTTVTRPPALPREDVVSGPPISPSSKLRQLRPHGPAFLTSFLLSGVLAALVRLILEGGR